MDLSSNKMSSAGTSDDSASILESLVNLGFEPYKAWKALAATGFKGVSEACSWLLDHIDDPNIDNVSFREYVVYLIPTKKLYTTISEFMLSSYLKFGWNEANNFLPHITLVPPFKVPDNVAHDLITELKEIIRTNDLDFLKCLKLEPYTSPNFLGLYVVEESSMYLSDLAKNLLALTGFSMEKQRNIIKNKFYVSLNYKFKSENYSELAKLMYDKIDPNVACEWKVKLFSRDPAYNSFQLFKCISNSKPGGENPIHSQTDLIYVKEAEMNKFKEQWIEGISWLSGSTTQLPLSYVTRTPITDSWMPIDVCDSHSNEPSFHLSEKSSKFKKLFIGMHPKDVKSQVEPLCYVKEESQEDKESSVNSEIYIMRHGERIDFTYGSWIPFCFDKYGNYHRRDLNLPRTLPKRLGGPESYVKDSPLTVIGETQARLTGEAMKDSGINIDHVIVSPSLRCVQTGHNAVCGLGLENKIKLKIEPGLFECVVWYSNSLPDWMTDFELNAFGFNIDLNYIPVVSESDLKKENETLEDFYNREFHVITTLLERTKESGGGNILLVGHSITLDACSRQLMGKPPRTSAEVCRFLPNVPYCSILRLCHSNAEGWFIKENGFPAISHGNNLRFDHSNLLE